MEWQALATGVSRLANVVSRATRRGEAPQPKIYAFADERDAIMRDVRARVVEACRESKRPLIVQLNESANAEIRRLAADRAEAGSGELERWQKLARRLGKLSEAELLDELEGVVALTIDDIAGTFDPTVFFVAQRIAPAVVAAAMRPRSAVETLLDGGHGAALRRIVNVEGDFASLRGLAEQGTLIFVPTHCSNLDSLVLGEVLDREGLPPVIYGAGKNLFTNPILSFFMHHLGAYRVDRRIKAPLYKQTLKTYSQVMLERGYHSLFFPGGTRCRSGMVERSLKLGLAGTAVEAYARRCMRGDRRRLFFVPTTLNYAVVLEAQGLIEDWLRESSESQFLRAGDESSVWARWLAFFQQLRTYDAACVLRVGQARDPFGNLVDEQGRSHSPSGRVIDPMDYVLIDGEPKVDAARDAAYTRELGRRLVHDFHKETVIVASQLVCHMLLRALVVNTPGMDLFGRMRIRNDFTMPLSELVADVGAGVEALRELSLAGELHLSPYLRNFGAAEVVERARSALLYHQRCVFQIEGDQVRIGEPTLVLYYANRLVPWARALAERGSPEEVAAAAQISALARGQ